MKLANEMSAADGSHESWIPLLEVAARPRSAKSPIGGGQLQEQDLWPVGRLHAFPANRRYRQRL